MIAIIYGHCSWFTIAVPIQNPIYVEQVGNKTEFGENFGSSSPLILKPKPEIADCFFLPIIDFIAGLNFVCCYTLVGIIRHLLLSHNWMSLAYYCLNTEYFTINLR